MIKLLRNWLWALRAMRDQRAGRKLHNDRDYSCRYWWGDRGGYDLRAERCPICNPEGRA